MRIVCFYSDYGYQDDFAGTCRAVMKRAEPMVEIIDVTHGLEPQDVRGAAFVLRNTLPYMPSEAVHLAIVDPGVGGPRRAVALRSAGDRLFVGPDNGLLTLACAADGGIVEAFELNKAQHWLEPVSSTFHGRDIFAPVAARLAAGLPLTAVGDAIDPAILAQLIIPQPKKTKRGLKATVVLVDRYGNIALNLNAEQLDEAALGERIEIVCAGERYLAQVAHTFSSARPSDIVVLVDSYGQVAVAVNAGSAEDVLNVEPGDTLELRRLTRA
jgi:S-adenosylmethionine hydrolase